MQTRREKQLTSGNTLYKSAHSKIDHFRNNAKFLTAIAAFVSVTLSSVSFAPTATAAPKSSVTAKATTKPSTSKGVAIKVLTPLAPAPSAEGLLISGKTLVTYLNTGGSNSNIQITGLDANGVQLWQKVIDSGADEIALASAVDPFGNLWFAGASAPITPVDTATVQLPTDNPDGVVVEPITALRADMTLLTLWKVSSNGDLLGTYTAAQSSPALVNGISVKAGGISIVGQLSDKPFLISATNAGVFEKTTFIGTSKTQLNAVIRNSDGTVNVFGTSSETLGGKKNVGTHDGVLIKVGKTGTISSVVRSSAPKANRSWISADSTLSLTGYVKTGKVIETAFTKFTAAFAPTWTIRVPSTGQSQVLSVGTGATAFTYGALSSNSAIPGVTGWKPTSPQLAVLGLNSKGVISAAYGFNSLATPLALSYSKEVGIYGLAVSNDNSISLFKLG